MGDLMFNGYRKNHSGKHMVVPSTRHFSAITNQDDVTIGILLGVGFAVFIASMILMDGLWFIGVPLFLLLVVTIVAVSVRFSNSYNVGSSQGRDFIRLEEAYHAMSKAHRKQYKNYLELAYKDKRVFSRAMELFTERGETDKSPEAAVTQLDAELKLIEDAKQIYKESMQNG
jgi:hypothetical protein